jgi:hypothetical protein
LQNVGVLARTRTNEGEHLELRGASLTHHWKRLQRLIEQRSKIRTATQEWLQSGESGALLSGAVAKKASAYNDLNEQERTFVAASRRRAHAVAALVCALALLLVMIPIVLYEYVIPQHILRRWDSKITEVKSAKDPRDQADALRWLAANQWATNGTSQNAIDPQNGRPRAPRAAIDLTNSTLNGIQLPDIHVTQLILTHA